MTDDQWYDLFESVAANLRHGNLTRKQQHEELARIVAAERERWRDAINALADEWDDPAEAYGMRLALNEGLKA
jgi:hypothetical protein